VKVLLKVSNEYRLADCDFATVAEVDALANWSRQIRGDRDQAVEDALEFAALARKRWQTYVEMNRTARTVASLKRTITAEPTAEVAMLAVIRLQRKRTARVLGFCLFRRTWCNHLILDLLATNPAESAEIGRVGVSLVYFIASIGALIGAPFVWGEATEGSAPYYNQWFNTKRVDDLFRIDAAGYRGFRSRYREKWQESGLPQA
jgi:hypothetical protein